MTSKILAKRIAHLTLTKKASNVLVMDLRKLTSMTDFFVVCSADTDTQVKAIADAVVERLEEDGIRVWHNEGISQLRWVLLDYVDVVVHIFQKRIRQFYNLEKLWGDAKFEQVEDAVLARKHRRSPVVKKRTKA
ncbi:MAG: ribosome silencing factor [Bacteroidota bacterium]